MAFPGASPPDPTSTEFCTGAIGCSFGVGVGAGSESAGSLVGAPSGADEERVAPDENCMPP